jgi:hypothetical protein
MSFPTSPVNGSTAVVNGISYQYVSTQTAWYRVSSQISVSVPSSITSTLTISNTSSSTSTTTGALVVQGGAGIGGSLYVANTSYIAGAQVITTATISSYAAAASSVSTSTTSTFTILNNTTATSTQTGALVVVGGVGVGGNIYAGNIYTNNAQILPTSIQEFTSVQGQTIYSVSGGFATGQVQVFVNGIALSSADYTAVTPVITLNTQRNAGDIVKTIVGQQFAVPVTQVSAAAAMAMVLGI